MRQLEKYALLFVRVYFGAFNLASGINFFFHAWPQPVPDDPVGRAYMNVTLELGLFQLAKALEILGGLCLVTDFCVPLGLALLAPVTITIFVMNVFFSPLIHVVISGARNLVFHGLLVAAYFGHFRGLLKVSASPAPLWRAATYGSDYAPQGGSRHG